jgi:putative CocE/NonD family hydrolase
MRRILAIFLLMPFAIAQQAPAPKPPENPFDMIWALKIPMRDGVQLNATVYRPHAQKETLPVIFTFTPYIGDSYQDRAEYFAQNGYVYALVDVRGRGNSGGTFEPFANDARDGYDVVEFLARQPWSNGKVAMWGGSYAGFDQWATLKEFPPHLVTIVPAAAAAAAVDFPFHKNIFGSYDIQWLTFTSGVTSNANLFGNSKFWRAKFREMYNQHRAFRELDQVVGNGSTVWQKWMQHPTPDPYWFAMRPSAEQFARMDLPILTITGHYDGDQQGALWYYRGHMQNAGAAAQEKHYIIIGPWDHAGTRTPQTEFDGMKFAEASKLDLNHLHKQWYDWTMKGGAKPEFLKKHVAYYVPTADLTKEEWKYADSLQTLANEKRVLYLVSDGNANDVFHSGALTDAAAQHGPQDHYVYDPMNTRPGNEVRAEGGLTSQAEVMNLYGEGLIYHSSPFENDTEISGPVKLTVWLKMDVPDTDIEVNLYEILPSGRSVALTSDEMRARYRASLTEAKAVPSGEIEKYEFDTFQWFSRRVTKGSRLRLVIKAPNSPGTEKNYNSGGAVENETGKDARTAHVTLYHDVQYPSQLELPVVK